jgi:TetR/AcrR family transcriptional repressor of nem operon
VRYRPEHKVEIHRKIVKDASRRVRAEGLTGAAVSAVMKDAGLTHGGFYKHFGSKDDLLLENAWRSAGTSRACWRWPTPLRSVR